MNRPIPGARRITASTATEIGSPITTGTATGGEGSGQRFECVKDCPKYVCDEL